MRRGREFDEHNYSFLQHSVYDQLTFFYIYYYQLQKKVPYRFSRTAQHVIVYKRKIGNIIQLPK